MRYRTRRHKLGSQGTGDAAGFTISPPAIALFSLSHTHIHHHSFPPSHPRAHSALSLLQEDFMQIHGCPGQCVANCHPEISSRNRGDEVENRKIVSMSRAFAEISRSGLERNPAGICKIRAWRTRNGSANEGTETHFLRSLRNYNAQERVHEWTLRLETKGLLSSKKSFAPYSQENEYCEYILSFPSHAHSHTCTYIHAYTRIYTKRKYHAYAFM